MSSIPDPSVTVKATAPSNKSLPALLAALRHLVALHDPFAQSPLPPPETDGIEPVRAVVVAWEDMLSGAVDFELDATEKAFELNRAPFSILGGPLSRPLHKAEVKLEKVLRRFGESLLAVMQVHDEAATDEYSCSCYLCEDLHRALSVAEILGEVFHHWIPLELFREAAPDQPGGQNRRVRIEGELAGPALALAKELGLGFDELVSQALQEHLQRKGLSPDQDADQAAVSNQTPP